MEFSVPISWRGVSAFVAQSNVISRTLSGVGTTLINLARIQSVVWSSLSSAFASAEKQLLGSNNRAVKGMMGAWKKLKATLDKLLIEAWAALAPVAEVFFNIANSAVTGPLGKVNSSINNFVREWTIKSLKLFQVMVSSVVKVIAEIYGLIWKFRGTNLATTLGMGMDESEYIIGGNRYNGLRRLGETIGAFDIEGAIAGVQNRNAAQAVGDSLMKSTGLGNTLTNISQITGLAPGNISEKFMGGLASVRNSIAMGWLKSQLLFPEQRLKPPPKGIGLGMPLMGIMDPMALAMRGQAMGIGTLLAKQPEALSTASLSATEANTRQGFAQRARARKEDEVVKLSKQQLEVLKDIKNALEKPTQDLAPANLLGVGL